MNTNQPAPNPTPGGDAAGKNDAIMKKLNFRRWKNRVLTGLALSVGLLSMAVGIGLAAAVSHNLFPSIRMMLKDSPPDHPWNGWNTNSVGKSTSGEIIVDMADGRHVSSADPQWRQAVVALMLGKVVFLTSVAIAILGVGTFLTLLLVIFNRRTTLRQVNESLAQISLQIKGLQGEKSEEPAD